MNLHDLLNIQVSGFPLEKPLILLIKALLICTVTWAGVSMVKFLFRRTEQNRSRVIIDRTAASFIRSIIIYVLYTLGGAVLLSLIPGMEKVGNSILAGAGILAMAAGLASQEVLSNFISGLFIVLGKPFRIGDMIKIDDTIVGTVVMISLRHTTICNLENRMIIVPNSKMNTSVIVNSTIGDPNTCCFIEVGVAYDTDLDKAIEIMREEIMKQPLLIDRRSAKDKKDNIPQVIIRVVELGNFSITLKAWAWASNYTNASVLKYDSLKSIKERFDKEGIEIPYPYNNVILTNVTN
ncbi:Small-conductance mechanosensitive channel [termite gut metagenome]|uniref:Small-conductance mechanosensitive channel n=1 Tax=termite gut metagenome TaxID=433724 RepID=A0A5J4S4H5_9ZZZZ